MYRNETGLCCPIIQVHAQQEGHGKWPGVVSCKGVCLKPGLQGISRRRFCIPVFVITNFTQNQLVLVAGAETCSSRSYEQMICLQGVRLQIEH